MTLGKQPLEPVVKHCPNCKSRQVHDNGVEEFGVAGTGRRSSNVRAYFVCQKCGSEAHTTQWRRRDRVVGRPLPALGAAAAMVLGLQSDR